MGRGELEAAVCVHNDDNFIIRFTLSKVRWWRRLGESFNFLNRSKSEEVVLTGSHPIIVDNFSKIKAASLVRE